MGKLFHQQTIFLNCSAILFCLVVSMACKNSAVTGEIIRFQPSPTYITPEKPTASASPIPATDTPTLSFPTNTTTTVPEALILTPSPIPQTTPVSFGDLHIHTICSDGKATYEQIIEQALLAKLDFIAITDHRINTSICRENLKKCRQETRLLCLPGKEVSGRVHLLAIGIEKDVNPDLPLARQVEEIHKQGGLAIAAHPFSPKWLYTEEDFNTGLDAIECPPEIPRSPLSNGLRCVYDSDTHDIYVANMLKCYKKIDTLDDLKQAIHDHLCTRWDLPLE